MHAFRSQWDADAPTTGAGAPAPPVAPNVYLAFVTFSRSMTNTSGALAGMVGGEPVAP
jgi:hypothetical protein